MNLREFLNARPWIGWAFSGVLLVVCAYILYARMNPAGDEYSGDRMMQMVTIKYTDTGKEEQMPRGRLIKMLLDQGGAIDMTKGIINPETKAPTGFIYDKAEWEALVKQLNADREEAQKAKPVAGKPAGGGGK